MPTNANPDAAPLETPAFIGEEPGIVADPRSDANVSGMIEGLPGAVMVEPPPVAPPPAPMKPLRTGGVIRPPTRLKDVAPVYPAIAQSARVQGDVIIEATIGPDGKVQEARVLRSVPLLDQSAVDAVRSWEYSPTLLNGQPVAVIMTVTVRFRLR